MEETQFINGHSPVFLKYKLTWLLEQPIPVLQSLFNNNYVDIVVDAAWATWFPFSSFTEAFTGYRKLNFIISTADAESDENLPIENEEINLLRMIELHIEGLPYSEALKKKLFTASSKIYNTVMSNLNKGSNE